MRRRRRHAVTVSVASNSVCIVCNEERWPELIGHGDVGIYQYIVPHKAVAEVSKIGNYRSGELLWCMDGRANLLMDRKVVEASLSLSLYLFVSFSLCLFIYLSLSLSICLSACLSICLFFGPFGAAKHLKHSVSQLFYPFAHFPPFSSDYFSSLIFFLLPVSSLTLPTPAALSVHTVGSLTSKLPSVIFITLLTSMRGQRYLHSVSSWFLASIELSALILVLCLRRCREFRRICPRLLTPRLDRDIVPCLGSLCLLEWWLNHWEVERRAAIDLSDLSIQIRVCWILGVKDLAEGQSASEELDWVPW